MVSTTKKAAPKTDGLTVIMYDLLGKEEGKIAVAKELFGAKVNMPQIAYAVRVYLTNQRQGNASTKTRGEVVGSTRKIYRQKGTGKARHGDIKAPIFVGGGTVGGPTPKDYTLKIGKKQKQEAFVGALSLKQKDGQIIALTEKALKIEPKTKKMASFLKSLKLDGKKVIFVLDKMENNLLKAIRNLENVDYVNSSSLNTYQVLNYHTLIFLENALKNFRKNQKNEN